MLSSLTNKNYNCRSSSKEEVYLLGADGRRALGPRRLVPDGNHPLLIGDVAKLRRAGGLDGAEVSPGLRMDKSQQDRRQDRR